jgi:sensor histidine kinase YesM
LTGVRAQSAPGDTFSLLLITTGNAYSPANGGGLPIAVIAGAAIGGVGAPGCSLRILSIRPANFLYLKLFCMLFALLTSVLLIKVVLLAAVVALVLYLVYRNNRSSFLFNRVEDGDHIVAL